MQTAFGSRVYQICRRRLRLPAMSEEGHEERSLDNDDNGALSEDDSIAEAERQSANQHFENDEFLRRMRHYQSVLGIPLPYVGQPPGHVGSPDRSDPNDSDRSDPNDLNDDIGSPHQDSENDLAEEGESDESGVPSSDAAVAENQNEDQIDDDEIDEGPPELNEEELLAWDLDRDTSAPDSAQAPLSDLASESSESLEDEDNRGNDSPPPKRGRFSDV